MALQNLWMYVVRGSGLWFSPGLVLELSDALDLAMFLNMSKNYSTSQYGSKMALIEAASQLLRGRFDSISFAHHIDAACCHRMIVHELVSLHNFSLNCPVSEYMRRGWPGQLRGCRCAEGEHVC